MDKKEASTPGLKGIRYKKFRRIPHALRDFNSEGMERVLTMAREAAARVREAQWESEFSGSHWEKDSMDTQDQSRDGTR